MSLKEETSLCLKKSDDITTAEVDVIVNAVNVTLAQLTVCVAERVRRK